MRILYHPGAQLCNINYSINSIDFNTGIIEYSITSGRLPITVELIGTTTQTNNHSSYGTYTFTGVAEEDYEFRITDVINCTQSEFIIPFCDTCPDGYEPYQDGCIKYDIVTPTYYPSTYSIKKMTATSSYGLYGAFVFDIGWNYDGTGTYSRILPDTNTYWANNPSSLLVGPMNRTSVWGTTTYSYQDVGFSFCIDIAITKQYYVGFGCDNWGKVKLNGEMILDQDLQALKTMFGSSSDATTFNRWYIYPLVLPAGKNIIEVIGHNEGSVAAVGIQIYDATKQDLINATNENPLGDKILFSSETLAGEPLHYEYSTTNGYHGYVCPTGYALDTCGETFQCVQRDIVECPPAPTSCVEYGLLYNWYAATDTRNITSSDEWVVPRYTLNTSGGDFQILGDYLGGVSTFGGKIKETGTVYWNSPNAGATNEVGFNVRGAGLRLSGSYFFLKDMCNIWTNCESDTNNAVFTGVSKDTAYSYYPRSTGYDANSKKTGQSVRLVRTSTILSHGQTGTYIGNDGREYQTICIGTQEWLSENLIETQYRNGDPIPIVEDNTTWTNLTTGAACAYNNDYNNVGCDFTPPVTGPLLLIGTEYNNNRIIQTEDEITWTGQNIGFATQQIRTLYHKDGLWLAGGYLPDSNWNNQDTMMYSTDGINWTGLGTSIFAYQCNGITYGNGTWVAVGAGTNTIAYCTGDPTVIGNWTGLGNIIFTGSYNGYEVVYDNGIFIALGDPGTSAIATSPDGINWTARGNIFSYFGTDAAYDGIGRWVASGVGSAGSLAYSDDNGATWTQVNQVFPYGDGAYGITYGNGKWVAVGGGNNSTDSIAYSTDGVNWTGVGKPVFNVGYDIVFYNNSFYAVGSGIGYNDLAKSSDGISWTAINTGIDSVFTCIGHI